MTKFKPVVCVLILMEMVMCSLVDDAVAGPFRRCRPRRHCRYQKPICCALVDTYMMCPDETLVSYPGYSVYNYDRCDGTTVINEKVATIDGNFGTITDNPCNHPSFCTASMWYGMEMRPCTSAADGMPCGPRVVDVKLANNGIPEDQSNKLNNPTYIAPNITHDHHHYIKFMKQDSSTARCRVDKYKRADGTYFCSACEIDYENASVSEKKEVDSLKEDGTGDPVTGKAHLYHVKGNVTQEEFDVIMFNGH